MVRTHTVVESPLGLLTLRADDGVLSGLFMTDHRHGPSPAALGVREDHGLPAVREQLAAYFGGELTAFDVPLTLHGTGFQRRVWAALQEIPCGTTTTYGGLAALLGVPAAPRGVGLANGRNPISIVVPCHRVVGATGALTGYGGGIDRKRALLALEARVGGREPDGPSVSKRSASQRGPDDPADEVSDS